MIIVLMIIVFLMRMSVIDCAMWRMELFLVLMGLVLGVDVLLWSGFLLFGSLFMVRL